MRQASGRKVEEEFMDKLRSSSWKEGSAGSERVHGQEAVQSMEECSRGCGGVHGEGIKFKP